MKLIKDVVDPWWRVLVLNGFNSL